MNSSSWDVANCQQGKQWKEGKLLPPLAQPTGKVKEAICGFLREIVAGSLQTGSSSRHRYNFAADVFGRLKPETRRLG
jgi:hypothetical protein